jgi:predicted metalloprotease with PDZ domain
MRNRAAALAAFVIWSACAALAQGAAPPVEYTVSLADPAQHMVHVRVHLGPGAAERDLQLPVWNALYQVRDFAQYVRAVWARDVSGQPLPVRQLDKTTWRVAQAQNGCDFEYDIFADQSGPFGAQLSYEHAFFNLAEILTYPVGGRDARMKIAFANVPSNWRIAMPLAPADRTAAYTAENYDRLVDSPVEIGSFAETWFEQDGARYRVVVHADAADYDLNTLAPTVRKIVAAAVSWMDDRPFREYVFIFHFPRAPTGGGMEHAYAAAIDINATTLAESAVAFPSLTAHEFFHLWNVKRIRPQSLEPIDYTRENHTRALWFSEGVTSTVGDYILLRAGLLNEQQYLARVARAIGNLQERPARMRQSVEESSLDTWFDKYPHYALPERSISYYNKGEIVGVLLDLAIRDATQGSKSLRDVFRWMNEHYARQGRFFPDSEGVREAVEAVSGVNFRDFFRKYVAGVEELPYDQLFRTVGLRLQRRKTTVADAGFTAVVNFDSPPVVVTLAPGGPAEAAGLLIGDTLISIKGKPVTRDPDSQIAALKAGETIRLRVGGRKSGRELQLKLRSREDEDYAIVERDDATPDQRAHRAAWLAAGTEAAGAAAQ